MKMSILSRLLSIALLAAVAMPATASDVLWTSSTDQQRWLVRSDVKVTPFEQDEVNDVMVTQYKEQQMLGFGGCFGELGWDALQLLDEADRKAVMRQLFDANDGVGFAFCRTPIGANDFARDYYSLNDHKGDFKMRHFSIDRDRTGLIPYIKAALDVNPQLRLWACPWTPPTWMKVNNHYATKAGQGNGYPGPDMTHGQDQFILKKKYLEAYATYFSKYLTAYRREGIDISMIMFQNEPYTINIWPNCSWSPQGTRLFLGKYLGPKLQKEHPGVQMWYGTMNTNNLDEVLQVVADPVVGRYIAGVGFQWEGKDIVKPMRRKYPLMPLMCTENECGSGTNDWAAAEHTLDMVKSYIDSGVNAYMYFNMVLKDKGTSSWGWDQNTLVVVNSADRTVTYTPEFYLMKHLSHHIKPQAVKLKTMGNDESMMAFRNPDGAAVVFIANKSANAREMKIAVDCKVLHVTLDAHSFNTFVVK